MRTAPYIVLLVALATTAAARQVEVWSYERLFKEAEVVVIASAQRTVDTGGKPADAKQGKGLLAQETTFVVHSTLKGAVAEGPLTLRHFKKDNRLLWQNGPLLVTFRTKEMKLEGTGARKFSVVLPPPQYLLFLKAAGDGRYVPVSGQYDSALSVKELNAPLPADEDAETKQHEAHVK